MSIDIITVVWVWPQDLLMFMTASLLLNVTPGPDMLFVAARSLGGGRATGIAAALGIALGCVVHIAALAFGVSTLVVSLPAARTAIRFLGGSYLVWLGVRSLLRPPAVSPGVAISSARMRQAVMQGCLTNILNPKVALFFLAFIPQFIRYDNDVPVAVQVLCLGGLFNFCGTAVNLLVALGAGRAAAFLVRSGHSTRALQRVSGGVMVALGSWVVLDRV